MRQARQQRITSLQANKENELNNNSQLGNLPSLRQNTNKLSLKNEYQLNLQQRKKTYLHLCTKRDRHAPKPAHDPRREPETARLGCDQTLSTQMSGVYLSSRAEKNNYRSTGRAPCPDKYQMLERHEINIRMRAKMVDWLLEITEAYKCRPETLFLAIFLMDQYFTLSQRPLGLGELHLIGVTCIYMACKYEEIHAIRMKTLVRDIAHNKISAREITNKEADILITLGFKFQRRCLFLTSQEILSEISQYMPGPQGAALRNNLDYFCKLIAFDCDLLGREDPELLAKGAILAAIRHLPEGSKNLDLYDSFITSCGRDYESSHHLCSRILFLHVNFKTEFGRLENIHRMCPLPHPLLNSCQL